MLSETIEDDGVIVEPIIESTCDILFEENPTCIPLLIGCSGGGGHNAAIIALGQFLAKKDIPLPEYSPIDYQKKQHSLTALGMFAAAEMQTYTPIKNIWNALGLPDLPDPKKIRGKITTLEQNNKKNRNYIDMFLDVYPTGYENVAIWDILQCEDQKTALENLVSWQVENDKLHKHGVYTYFLNLLESAHATNKPYTDIFCTQANGLAGLCKAVHTYNQKHNTQVIIHQYMTDLPTSGAVHFFHALAGLKPYQQAQMKLYAVNMTLTTMNNFFSKGYHFQGIYTINPKNNPMVRCAFYDEHYNNSAKREEPVTLNPTVDATIIQPNSPIVIDAHEKIATIMLGSQAGMDTKRYIPKLLHCNFNKIFVFIGTNQVVKDKITHQLSSMSEEQRSRVILLGPQDAPFIAALMTRSNLLIIRSGGLTVMEQMAMQHHHTQIICIHHSDRESEILTSGISWEDDNANHLIDFLSQENIRVIKSSPYAINEILCTQFNGKELHFEIDSSLSASRLLIV
jgi:effector protein SdbA